MQLFLEDQIWWISRSLGWTWRKVFQGIANAIAYMEGGDVPKAYHGSCEGSLEHVGTWKSAVVGVPRRHKSDDILCGLSIGDLKSFY